MNLIPTFLLIAAVAIVGCKKGKPGPARETAETFVDDGAPPDFSNWDLTSGAVAWQGSWLVKSNSGLEAWTITGDKVRAYNGETEAEYDFSLESPCSAKVTIDENTWTTWPFAIIQDELAPGDGGVRKGDSAVLCLHGVDLMMLDESGRCSLWIAPFEKRKKVPAPNCGFRKTAVGDDVFFHDAFVGRADDEASFAAAEYMVRGNAIYADKRELADLSASSERGTMQKIDGDFAAAKAAHSALVAAP